MPLPREKLGERLKKLPKRSLAAALVLVKLLYFRPLYLLLAIITSIIFYEIVYWFLNIGLVQFLFTSSALSLQHKINIIISSYTAIFAMPFSPLLLLTFIVSVLQGASIAGLVFMIHRERVLNNDVTKSLGGAGIAGVLSVLGLGCTACGTSLVTPLLAIFISSSTTALAEQIGIYSAIFAFIAALTTVYLVGRKLTRFSHAI